MKILLLDTVKETAGYVPFHKNLYLDNPERYLITVDTEYGEFNLSEVASLKNEKDLTDTLQKTISIIKDILASEDAEENFNHWSTICYTMNELLDSNFREKYSIIEVKDLEEWAEQQLLDLGYLSNFTPSVITNHIDLKGIANELLEDYYYELLDNGNTLIWQEN